jgi:hypothetical protein
MVKKDTKTKNSGIIEVPTTNNERSFRLDARTVYHTTPKRSPFIGNRTRLNRRLAH